jgi:hypothetical protein
MNYNVKCEQVANEERMQPFIRLLSCIYLSHLLRTSGISYSMLNTLKTVQTLVVASDLKVLKLSKASKRVNDLSLKLLTYVVHNRTLIRDITS